MAVIDASLYVALMNTHEPHHARSWAWFKQVQVSQEKLSAPVILLAEVAAALGRGTNNPTLAHQITQHLIRSKIVDLAPITQKLAERAAEIAADHQIRGCDAIYIALAEQLKDDLITLDQQQFERAAALIITKKP